MADGTRGRRKKTISEQKQSNQRLRPDKAGNPVKITQKPTKPRGLDKAVGKLWDTYAPVMIRYGIATKLDEPELRALFQHWAWFVHFADLADATDDIEEMATLIAIANKSYDQFSKCSKRFGMTPLDRQRLRECGEETVKSEIEAFLSGGLGVVDDSA